MRRRPKTRIQGNRSHDILIDGGDARALETAASGLEGDNITVGQCEAAAKRLRELAKRYRAADRKAKK